ncbi:MAG: sulfide/dihydroorotate dehydrogenase-like FAD/NAD-binding protein [Alkaliphilus sp.]
MSIKGEKCIDVGSDYCPCYLSEMNNCITCSYLRGEECCDCSWSGVCIYNEFYFLNYRKKEIRTPQCLKILKREDINDNIIIFTIKTSHTLTRHLKQPGSYVFIRNKNFEHYFDMPISIMQVDDENDEITIAVEVHGVKTESIKLAEESLLIKGPYWNALFGIEFMKKAKNNNCLIIARGIAQAPAVLAANYLLKNNNRVDVIVDKGNTNTNFIKRYTEANILSNNLNLYKIEGKKMIRKCLEFVDYNIVLVSGSDALQKEILTYVKGYSNANVVLSNNKEMCCGEGICGACIVYDSCGIPIRSCKTQISNKNM